MAKIIRSNGRGSEKRLTQKDLATRWGCVLRTVQRRIREGRLKPVYLTGIQPVFSLSDVVAFEKSRADQWGRKQALFRRFGLMGQKKRMLNSLGGFAGKRGVK